MFGLPYVLCESHTEKLCKELEVNSKLRDTLAKARHNYLVWRYGRGVIQ